MTQDKSPRGVYKRILADGTVRYKAELYHNRIKYYLGTYATENEAAAVFILKKSQLKGEKFITTQHPPKRIYPDRILTKEIKNALSGTPWNGLLL